MKALGSVDFSGHLSTSDLDKYADFIVIAKTNADKAQLFAEFVERHFGILIRITLMKSTNLSRIIIAIFILLRTQMTTDLMLEMNISLWPMLTPKPSLS